jgi:ubiquinol-cytochrome c reductase cytochrome b subunit
MEKTLGTVANYVDERTGAAGWVKKSLNKVFPDHWSFMLGEVCMYSFIILLLSGTFLTCWFDPSQRDVIYQGVYEPLKGKCLRLIIDFGYLFRSSRWIMASDSHWSALIFMAAIVAHLPVLFHRCI